MDTESSNSITSSEELPLLTFNSLYNLRREEKRLSTLQKLPENFYKAAKKFLDDKKKEILKLKDNNEKDKFRKEQLVLKNSKKILLELISIRGTKVSRMALQNALLEDEDMLNTKEILPEELEIYDSTQKSINTLKEEIV